VPRLALLLRDFFPPRIPELGEGAPRLEALEYWLARSRRRPAPEGWRGWLAQTTLGMALPDGDGGAGLAATALLGAEAGRYFWFATPVHYLAGLDTLHLPAGGLLSLADAQQRRLVADFAQVFRDSPWRLHALGFRDLLLEGPDPGLHETHDPASVAGADLAAVQPRGAGVRALRQLAAEIEMWLHEHPLNLERERQGEPPVTGLWPWGAGRARAARSAAGAALRLHGEDAFSAALAIASGRGLQPLPASAAALETAADDTALVVAGACVTGWPELSRLEQQWFAPLLAQLRAGRWSVLTLIFGTRRHELRRVHRWRGWRRARAWWAEIGR
jgi:hypothetical protein